MEFTIGQGRLPLGFEKTVLGMEPGESKTVRVPSALGYGPHNPEKVIEVSRSKMPEGLEQEIGVRVEGSMPGSVQYALGNQFSLMPLCRLSLPALCTL